MSRKRTFRRVGHMPALPGYDVIDFGTAPIRFVVEGEPRCDDFLLHRETWERMGEPARIEVAVSAVSD